MYIYIFVGILLVFAIWKERQALGCSDNPFTLADCDNANGKAIRGTKSSPSDPTDKVVENVKKAADFADRWVIWRIALLLSFPCVVIIYFFLNSSIFVSSGKSCFSPTGNAEDIICSLVKSFPSEKELVVGMFVITAVVYFTLNFYKFHLINYAKRNIDEGVDILASRIAK